MSSTFETEFAATALPDILSTFGVAVTYTPAGGEAVAVAKAVWEEDPPETVTAEDGSTRIRRARVVIAMTDVAAPVRGATLTVDAEDWSVLSVAPQAGAHTLDVQRVELVERSREDLRARR